MKHKVFLGGTCCGSTWRNKLIPQLKIDYFNPVVKDWTPDCIKEEYRQKNELCDLQLFVLTPDMRGVFSIAEAVDASNKIPDKTIFCILDKNKFSEGMRRSLQATEDLIKNNGAHICNSIEEVAKCLNSYENNKES